MSESPKCPECRGAGVIQLFTSARPCNACDGSGFDKLALCADVGADPARVTIVRLNWIPIKTLKNHDPGWDFDAAATIKEAREIQAKFDAMFALTFSSKQ